MTTSTLMPMTACPADWLNDPVTDPVRLEALRRTGLLDSPSEAAFDRLTRLAGRVLGAPVALVSLVDAHRQFFKSTLGLGEPLATSRETPLSHSFCQHVVRTARPLVVSDAREDPRVRDNLAIRDMGVIAYLGAPLTTSEGITLGAFCAIDSKPRNWSDLDLEVVSEMAASTMAEVELRQEVAQRRAAEQRLENALRQAEALNVALVTRTAELSDCNARLDLLARADGLTGLLNIRTIREELDDRAAMCRAHRLPMSVVMIDVDHFKEFNDTYGHPAGDEVLQTIAGLIKQGVRGQDLAGRYGGEEFILGLPGTGGDEAAHLAERLGKTIAAHPWPHRPITASFGVATEATPDHIPSLIRRADDALYDAKNAGRNRVHRSRI